MIYGFLTIGTQIKNSKKRPSDIFLNMVLDNQIHIDQGEVFNGADDDGSGTIAILEIAGAFQKAVKNGKGPKRSVVFLHVTA